MGTVFKWVGILVAIYFGVNWIADNPKTVDEIRIKMNTATKSGVEWVKKTASNAFDEIANEVKKST